MDFGNIVNNLLNQMAFFHLDAGNYAMIVVALVFLYLAIRKGYEPLLLIPIAFGMLLVNIYPEIMYSPEQTSNGTGGLLWYFFPLDEWSILPSLIFLGVGAMTDFGPLIVNPISFIMGAAAQLGIYSAYFLAILLGFSGQGSGRHLHHRRSGRSHIPVPVQQAGTDTDHGTHCSGSIFLYGAGANHPAAVHEAALLKERKIEWNSFVRYPSWRRFYSQSS